MFGFFFVPVCLIGVFLVTVATCYSSPCLAKNHKNWFKFGFWEILYTSELRKTSTIFLIFCLYLTFPLFLLDMSIFDWLVKKSPWVHALTKSNYHTRCHVGKKDLGGSNLGWVRGLIGASISWGIQVKSQNKFKGLSMN